MKDLSKTVNLLVHLTVCSKRATGEKRQNILRTVKQHGKKHELTREDWYQALRMAKMRVNERAIDLEDLFTA